jgi:hypothetical protein
MKRFKQFLLEVNSSEYNGTGNTPPPTVLYPTVDPSLDGSEIMTSGKPQLTNDQNDETDVFWSRWIKRYSDELHLYGATPEQIQKILKIMRQQFFLYHSGSQGSMTGTDIIGRMDRYYWRLLDRQPWYQNYLESVRLRGTINKGIDKVNNFTFNSPFNVPTIPNVNPEPTYTP